MTLNMLDDRVRIGIGVVTVISELDVFGLESVRIVVAV